MSIGGIFSWCIHSADNVGKLRLGFCGIYTAINSSVVCTVGSFQGTALASFVLGGSGETREDDKVVALRGISIVCLILILTLGGCSVEKKEVAHSKEGQLASPKDLRLIFDGISYQLCWEGSFDVPVRYRVYYSSSESSEESPGELVAEVHGRRIPLGLLGQDNSLYENGYLAVQAVSDAGSESPLSDSIVLDLKRVHESTVDYDMPDEILVVDLRYREHDLDDLLKIKCIQGLINRKYNMPKVYVIHRGAGADGDSVVDLTPGDVKWLMAARDRLDAKLVRVEPEELFEMYVDEFDGQVIYDKTKTEDVAPQGVPHYWTIPLAVTYAGVHNAIVTPTELPGLPILFDFRKETWTKLEAYEWAIEELIPKVNKEVAFINDAYAAYNMDYIIDKQALFMDLDYRNNTPERDMIFRILDLYPRITPVFGWSHKYDHGGHAEYELVNILDRAGHTLISDVGGATTNASFHSRVKSTKPIVQHTRYVEYESDKYYTTFVYSDGDAIGYIDMHLYQAWHWGARGKAPIGWQISPYLGIMAPHIAETYYTEATENDEFVLAVNGYGYSLPGRLHRMGHLSRYLYEVENLLSVMDYKTLTIVDYEPTLPAIDAWIKEYAARTSLEALFIEGGAIDENIGPVQSPLYQRGEPLQRVFERRDGGQLATFVMAHRGKFVDTEQAVRRGYEASDNVLGAIQLAINDPMKTNKFIYIYVFVYYMNPNMVADVVSRLPDNVRAVKPSEFANLFKEHQLGEGSITNAVSIENLWIHRGCADENVLFVLADIDQTIEYVEVHYRLEGKEDIYTRRMQNVGGTRYAVVIPEWTKDGYTKVTPVRLRIREKNGDITIRNIE